ncbi:hypothetical protein DYB25_005580 [Aphanomyces astaci]|uniref:Condensin complex subunit 1 C-terminal domain-containing protein n=1 Tax=Aphanomyces astaci TaxID=112090 RepID=A0A397API8_APHAT|nr:hypothetical protein DYB25_005580 [Aphanomyces astaci]
MLWRGLSATNDQVRKQAAIVLFQGFPYQKFHLDGNKSASKEDTDALLQKQVDGMLLLVQDTSPATRVVAVHGLAKLAPYLNDKQETVRAAFCRLLVRIKSIRNMHFYDIAPVDSCFLRLVMDAARPSVAKPITNLFLRSYFPQGASDDAQVARTLSLIEEHPVASRVFYRHVVHFSSVGAVCKLVVLLLHFVSCQGGSDNSDLANGVVWVVVDLLESIQKPLMHSKRYADCRRFIQDQVHPDRLHTILESFSAYPSVVAGTWHVISHLPTSMKDQFVLRALDAMAKFECSSNKLLLVGVLQCLVRWGEALTFVDSLLDQLRPKRIHRTNVALLLVCLNELAKLCDLSNVASSLMVKLEQHWPTFQGQMEPTSAILYAKVVWTLHQLEWMSTLKKRKGPAAATSDQPSGDANGSEFRLEVVPVLCEAMFVALQSATAVTFMQRVLELAMDEPALNSQLLSLLVAVEVDLEDDILGALLAALLETNATSCVWLTQLPQSTGLCRCLWMLLKQDAHVGQAINATKWPEDALQRVLSVGLQQDEVLPLHVVQILKSCRSLDWATKVASPTVLGQLPNMLNT